MMESVRNLPLTLAVRSMTNDDRPTNADGSINWEDADKMREEFPIGIDHDQDMISFKMLTKPASAGGNLNLCQLTDLIGVAKHMLEHLNRKFPCRHNAMTITKLDEALMWQKARTEDRKDRSVEGKNQL